MPLKVNVSVYRDKMKETELAIHLHRERFSAEIGKLF